MNVLVGCSSRNTDNECYNRIAEGIGEFIVSNGHNFVFGGCESGLMGRVYSTVLGSESDIIIAMAKAYADELESLTYSEVHLLDTVNERKDCFAKISDVMVFLPGGIGTADEILTAIETRRNHEHNLPIVIINANNYFEHLLEMLERIYDEGFADSKSKELYFVANSLEEATEYLSSVTV